MQLFGFKHSYKGRNDEKTEVGMRKNESNNSD